MTKRIKVAVSPFYGGTEWTDEFTGVTFKKNVNGLNVYSIPGDSDMTGIAAAIRLNALILFEGEISEAHTEAAKTYQEPGRWTETVVKKTEEEAPTDPEEEPPAKEELPVVEEDPEEAGIQTLSVDETPAYETVNPDDMTVDELSAHTEKYNIPVEGTGSNGNALKADYIAAIKAYQA